jgi:dipeptidyl aminopeptidase/acylaminoacyl peptidase
MKWFTILLMISLLPVSAQGGVTPQRVTIPAADGLTLNGDFYAAEGESVPAVLLLDWDMNDGNWSPLIPALHAAGYAVLNTSMRGYGQTLGIRNWPEAETDIQLWLDWLRHQPGIDPARVNIGGGAWARIWRCAAWRTIPIW